MIKSIIFGIIQGLTEFLPVSSSGHLVLSQHFLNKGVENSDLTFEVFLHLGSLLAVFIYFRKDIANLFLSIFKWDKNENTVNNHKTILYLLIATFVTGIFGFTCKDFFESLFSNALLVAVFISVTGIILFISDKLSEGKLNTHDLGFKKSLLIGLGQTIAITPGISRSGTTIAFSLFTKMKREEAARFSFLLSIPAILGANIGEINSLLNLNKLAFINYSAGFLAAFISGYLVIGLLLSMIKKAKLKIFSYYCWTVSLISIILISLGY